METYKPRILKRQVTIRTKAQAGERLDEFLKEHPELSEAEVTAAALNQYFDTKAGVATIEMPAAEVPAPLTSG